MPYDFLHKPTTEYRFYETSEEHYIRLKGPDSIAASCSFILPNTSGNAGDCLTTDGLGFTSWMENPATTTNTWTQLQTFQGSHQTTSPTVPFGYGVGSGGFVQQLTSKSTPVTINRPVGYICTHDASLADEAIVGFVVNNSTVGVDDFVTIIHGTGGAAGQYIMWCCSVVAGAFQVFIKNVSGAPLAHVLYVRFIVIKGAST